MQHRRRRDADFRRAARRRLEEIEIRSLNRRHMPDLAPDVHRRRLEADLGPVVSTECRDEFAVMGLDAFQALEEIDVKVGATELAVGDPLQPDVLLRMHHLADALVLDCMQIIRRETAAGEPFARRPEPLGPKKTADMVGAERRTGHRLLPWALQDRCARWSHASQPFGNRREPGVRTSAGYARSRGGIRPPPAAPARERALSVSRRRTPAASP